MTTSTLSIAVTLHPDKHMDPDAKQAALSRFREVQKAYEVLSDPEKRTVYDYFGEEGLNSTWTVATRGRTPEQMRAEFEAQKRTKAQEKAEDLVRSKGSFTAEVDASTLFAPSAAIRRPRGTIGNNPITLAERWDNVRCKSISARHGFSVPLTANTTGNVSGFLVTRNGRGGGNLMGTIKTQWSPRIYTNVVLTLLDPRAISVTGQYVINEFSYFNMVVSSKSVLLPPAFKLTYAQQLSEKSPVIGFTSFSSGSYTLGPWGKDIDPAVMAMDPPSVSVGVTKQQGDGGYTLTTFIGLANIGLSAERSFVVKALGDLNVRLGITLSVGGGAQFNAGGDRDITANTKLGLGLSISQMGGVSVALRFKRLGQKVTVPVMLSPAPRADLFVAAASVPLCGLYAFETLYLAPKKRSKLKGRLEQLRSENAELIRERRQAARDGVKVLRSQAKKKAASERSKSGLIVIEAFYGRGDALPATSVSGRDAEDLDRQAWKGEASSGPSQSDETQGEASEDASTTLYCDVRIPLQALVTSSQLVIPGGRSKSNLLGFYDAAMGERKVLRVRYLFRNQVHEAVFKDKEAVAVPLRAHQLEE